MTLAAVLAAIAAVLLWRFWFQDQRVSASAQDTEMPDALIGEPDVYMSNATISQYLPEGDLKYRLQAEELRHFEQDGLTRMTEPALELYSKAQPPWNISARQGFLREQDADRDRGEVVYLKNDVHLQQTHPSRGKMTIRSPSFYIYPDQQLAETDEDVMIDTVAGRTTAHGMRGNLITGVLTLSSNANNRVHTIVLPEQHNPQNDLQQKPQPKPQPKPQRAGDR